MRSVTFLAFPLLMLFFTGCADQATAPDIDVTASYAKPGGKPDKPGKPDPPPTVEPADPVLAFTGGRNKKNSGLWVADEDGGNASLVYQLAGGAIFRPAWSPNGTGTQEDPFELLFRVNWSIGKVRIYVDADGKAKRLGDPQVLSDNVNYVRLAVSPDGSQVVAVWSPIDGSSHYRRLVLTNPETFLPADDIYETTERDYSIGPATWSGDGEKIAFTETEDATGATTIKIIEVDTRVVSDAHSFIATESSVFNMSWARNSDMLVFDHDGSMYLLELEENAEGKLVAAGEPSLLGPGFGPVFSPDDSRIVYDTRTGVYVKSVYGPEPDLPIGGQWFADWRR